MSAGVLLCCSWVVGALQQCGDSTTAKYTVLGRCTQSFSGVCQTAKADYGVLSTTGMPTGDTRGSKTEGDEKEGREGGGKEGVTEELPLLKRENIKKI